MVAVKSLHPYKEKLCAENEEICAELLVEMGFVEHVADVKYTSTRVPRFWNSFLQTQTESPEYSSLDARRMKAVAVRNS